MRDKRAGYAQSLAVLERAKVSNPALYTKSSIMLGLGEVTAARSSVAVSAARSSGAATQRRSGAAAARARVSDASGWELDGNWMIGRPRRSSQRERVTATKHRHVVVRRAAVWPSRRETDEEVRTTMRDLRAAGVDVLTLGQARSDRSPDVV